MTDLGDFGVDVPEADEDAEEQVNHRSGAWPYRRARCRGLTNDGTRCRKTQQDGEDLCFNHGMQCYVSIDSPPRDLIRWTTGTDVEDLPPPVQAALEAVEAEVTG